MESCYFAAQTMRTKVVTVTLFASFADNVWMISVSVRPILRIDEYSLVALQHRRIRYIGVRVSSDAE